MQKEASKRLNERMDKALEALKKDLAGIRTGRASLSIFDSIMVDYFGTPTPINHVATLSVPESRLITIQPFDPKTIGEIEKAIQKSEKKRDCQAGSQAGRGCKNCCTKYPS